VNVASQSQHVDREGAAKMKEDESLSLEILGEFGLTENQAKVFLATTKLGTPTVAEVADASEVRREEIYRLLPELEKIGLVERLLGKPLRLKTLDPTSSITTLVNLEREKAKDRISELSMKSKKLLQTLGHHEGVSDHYELDSGFSLIQEKESIRVGLYELISKAEKQIDILFSRKDLVWLLSTQGESLRQAIENGVKIRIMSEPPSGRDRIPKILHRQFSGEVEVPLKYLLNPNAFYIIADKSQLIIITSGVEHLPSATCLWTNNKSLTGMTSSIFEGHWHDSVHWKTVDGITLAVAPQEESEETAARVHRFLLYRSNEVKEKVLFNFLKQRYEVGYMLLYICSNDCIKNIKDSIRKFEFDPKNIRLLNWEQWIVDDGKFSIDKTIDKWDELFFESQDLGLKGLAIASDMKFFFDNDLLDTLEEFEKQIHSMLEGQMDLKCAYDETAILQCKEPLQLYGRVVGYHTALLTEDKDTIKRSYRDA